MKNYINASDTVELVYNVKEGAEYFVSLYTSFVLIEEYIVMVNIIVTTEYLTL